MANMNDLFTRDEHQNIEAQQPLFLSVVAPVYDEATNISPFYSRLIRVIEQMDCRYEIIFVNDGSHDETLETLLHLMSKDSSIRIIDLSRNFGKEIALTAGIDAACGNVIVPIDVDLQDPPELIPRLLEKWRQGYDVVFATRSMRAGDTLLKRITANLFYRLMEEITAIKVPRATGDFRLMSRRSVQALRQLPEHHRFMKGLFSWIGFNQVGITYEREPRHSGHSKWSYWRLWNLALEGITSLSQVPLQLMTLAGILISTGAFIYAAFIVVHTLLCDTTLPGYPSLITVLLFTSGVQMLSLGILGEYIGRIHNEVKRRPLYLVKHTYGKNQAEPASEK